MSQQDIQPVQPITDEERAARIREYEAKRAEKAARFEQCAENAERRAAAAFDRADLREEKSGIPSGQPILVGHHSERRHRRAIERADNAMRKGIEEGKKAEYYARRADNAANGTAIMSDDPAADAKLAAKIAEAEKLQARMKACNAAIRTNTKAGPEAQVSALVLLGLKDTQARELIKPDFCGRIGFPDYALTNNNANIRRMKERLQRVSVAQAMPQTIIEGDNARFEDCPADNRVRLFYPGKPSEEIRSRLKSSGFRWSPSVGAWQAYRHNHTIEIAKREAGLSPQREAGTKLEFTDSDNL